MSNETKDNKKIDSQIGQALFSDTERFEMWFSTYWKPAAGVALVLALLTAVVFWVITAKNAADKKAAFALTDAADVPALTAALKTYGSHSGATMARYRLAKMLLDAGKNKEALAQLDLIVSNTAADKILVANAKIAAAYACEQAKDFKAAITRFLSVESDLTLPAPQRAEAGYSAGRLLLQTGDVKQAKAVLNRTSLLGTTPASVGYWTENAKQTLIALENGEYQKKAAPAKKVAPAKKAVTVKKAAPAKKAAAK